ncbi:MAG: 3-dehydroquinate synthase [Ignavibacteriae bacterium]|nr:3-dehydroquinate synthase [Ignavibacteria bacterium]MBI3364499.1 3-dehydroquinate synthase [Ignavibacteriota bacterium]
MRIHLKRIIDNSYDIRFVNNISEAGADIRSTYPDARVFIITDVNVGKHYAGPFARCVSGRTAPAYVLRIPAGEASKNRTMKESLEDQLISLGATRNSVIVALGGGMIGDLAGFVAATLHRGVSFIQIPTSLLAQVDSSIGGKVAVDHPQGKNLIGAFFQPKKVYIDVSTLKTLPDGEFRNGMAEVIKYGAILDGKLFTFLEKNRAAILRKNPNIMHAIIERCCELKRAVVEKDEREVDYRRILNFGHTIGHAVEQVSNYRIAHGKAVAIGMAAEAKVSTALGILSSNDAARLEDALKAFGLATSFPAKMRTTAIFDMTLRDKKTQQGKVHYTLLEKIGKARVGVPMSRVRAQELFER